MAWKLNKELLENSNYPLGRNLLLAVGDSLIVQVFVCDWPEKLDYLQLEDGRYVYAYGTEILFSSQRPDTEFWLMTSNNWRENFIKVGIQETSSQLSTEEYYLFGDTKYFDKEGLLAAIEAYAGRDGGTYYYTHHTEKEYCVEIDSSEKVTGEYDQSTLDKVNEILKSKGVDFVIKGE